MSDIDRNTQDFVGRRDAFLRFLKDWERTWPSPRLADVVKDAGGPERVAIICADLTLGFTRVGNLASPRVDSIVAPTVRLFKTAHALGMTNFILSQDEHPADSLQFRAYGPHSMPGTIEATTVPELTELPFADLLCVIPKQNLNPGIDTMLPKWLDDHMEVKRFIVVGCCTDLCIYQIAMFLRLRANQFKYDYEVLVPEDCVDTFEMEFNKARELQVLPHDADLLHLLFLYHMALNDIKVVRTLV